MPWTAKQYLWKFKAKEGYQLSRGGPSNRQKNDIKIASLATLFDVQSTLRLNGRLRLLTQSIVSTCASEKMEISSGWDTFLYTCECDDERACYLIIKKHVYSKTKYVNIPSFHSSHHLNSPLKLKCKQSTFVI